MFSLYRPTERSAMVKIYLRCTNYSHLPHMAIEHLKCDYCKLETEFLILFTFSSFKLK